MVVEHEPVPEGGRVEGGGRERGGERPSPGGPVVAGRHENEKDGDRRRSPSLKPGSRRLSNRDYLMWQALQIAPPVARRNEAVLLCGSWQLEHSTLLLASSIGDVDGGAWYSVLTGIGMPTG